MEKNAIITVKKKIICVLAASIILMLCAAAGYQLWLQYNTGKNFSYKVYDDHVELVQYLGEEELVIIPDTLKGKPITVIKGDCFYLNKTVKTVYLGRNILEIKALAFNCSNVEHVTGMAELETISAEAFAYSFHLRTVDVGNHVKRIERSAFDACSNLESIGEQPELEYIGNHAFRDTYSFTDFQIPEHTKVGHRIFWGSIWLEDKTQEFVIAGAGCLMKYNGDATVVEVPEGVTKLDGCVFADCANVENIVEIRLPDTVTEVETWAFEGCKKVRVYMPESVTAIDAHMLERHPDMSSSRLNDRVESELTIVTTSGSYAEEYAKKYKVDCEIVEPWW